MSLPRKADLIEGQRIGVPHLVDVQTPAFVAGHSVDGQHLALVAPHPLLALGNEIKFGMFHFIDSTFHHQTSVRPSYRRLHCRFPKCEGAVRRGSRSC